jgi:ribosomal-protein-alanine N-acetyltransferase
MSDHEPTVTDAVDDVDQPGERLDADKLPEEFPDRPLHVFDHGTTEREMAHRESLDGRLAREEPDVADRPGPDEDGDDVVGDEGGGGTAATALLDDADEDGEDRQRDLTGELSRPDAHDDDSGRPRVPVSAEESAMRIESPADLPDWDEGEEVVEELVEDEA